MADTDDPRIIVKGLIATYLTANPIKEDDGATNATRGYVYGDSLDNYVYWMSAFDVLLVYGDPVPDGLRYVDNEPVHYDFIIPVSFVTIDRTGITGAIMVYRGEASLTAFCVNQREQANGARIRWLGGKESNMKVGERIIYKIDCKIGYRS